MHRVMYLKESPVCGVIDQGTAAARPAHSEMARAHLLVIGEAEIAVVSADNDRAIDRHTGTPALAASNDLHKAETLTTQGRSVKFRPIFIRKRIRRYHLI